MLANKFKMRRVKRMVRRIFIGLSLVFCIIFGFMIFYNNYHYRLMNRIYNSFINTSIFFDFKVKNIDVYGCKTLSKKEILDAVHYQKNTPLFLYQPFIMAQQIQKILNVKYVSVRKRYPHNLDIFIKERMPIAQYIYKTKYALIDDQGVLYQYIDQKQKELPVLEGSGDFSKLFPYIFKIVTQFSLIQKNIQIYQLVKNRRWNLIMNDGSKVMLPQHKIEDALKIYQNMKNKKYSIIDLRVEKYIFLRD